MTDKRKPTYPIFDEAPGPDGVVAMVDEGSLEVTDRDAAVRAEWTDMTVEAIRARRDRDYLSGGDMPWRYMQAWRDVDFLLAALAPPSVTGDGPHYPAGIGVSNENYPNRPCAICGEPWPCQTRRVEAANRQAGEVSEGAARPLSGAQGVEPPSVTGDGGLPLIDASHDCESCRAQSSEFYDLPGRCLTCGQRFTVRNRKGDKPPLSVECPSCEVNGYSWRAALPVPFEYGGALANQRFPASPSEPPGLDAAWAEAEAALPKGWTGPFVGPHVDGDFWANAWLTYGASKGRPGQQFDADNLVLASLDAHGPTPAAALHALAARLATPSRDTEPDPREAPG